MPEIVGDPILSDKYLKDFVRMHENRLREKINEARANKLRRRLKYLRYPLLRW